MQLPTHPTATIFRKGVLDNPDFRFNHITSDVHWVVTSSEGVYDCNGLFPMKRGYKYDSNLGKPPHPDDKHSFFFWRDYNTMEEYTQDEEAYDPEWMHSIWRKYVFDGSTNCWDGSTPSYPSFINDWDDGYFEHSGEGLRVPIACLPLDEETPTDRDRRITYYRQHECIWALRDCNCSSSGAPCYKVETERYKTHGPCMCGFGDYREHNSDDEEVSHNDGEGWRTWTLGTNCENTLARRMQRLGSD